MKWLEVGTVRTFEWLEVGKARIFEWLEVGTLSTFEWLEVGTALTSMWFEVGTARTFERLEVTITNFQAVRNRYSTKKILDCFFLLSQEQLTLIGHLRQDFAFSSAYSISELTTHDYMINLLGTVIGPLTVL